MIRIFSDTAANLSPSMIEQYNIEVVDFQFYLDEKEFDNNLGMKKFYDAIRNGAKTRTSLIPVGKFSDAFEKYLSQGDDVIYVGLSSGVSGTLNSSRLAKEELDEKYPERKIGVIDSYGAGLGEGMIAIQASRLVSQGLAFDEIMSQLEEYKWHVCQYFTVDDLKYLKNTGRVSFVVAFAGNALKIKPVLTGSEDGHIIVVDKAIGTNNSYKKICDKYVQLVKDKTSTVYISHADNLEGANYLKNLLVQNGLLGDCIIEMHEPMSGTHLGPGAVALFFEGIKK